MNRTVSEVSGTHVSHIPSSTTGDEGWDRFSFSIKLEDYKRKLEERQLLLCVRFSIDGREWWDSNDGLNYQFSFKKTPPKRLTRASGPASFGGGFMRLNDPEVTATIAGLRQSRGQQTAEEINKAFGVFPKSLGHRSGPNDWIFPKLGDRLEQPSRPDSPMLSPPPTAFKAPPAPDVHSHLQLKKYCAPSPPLSPPKEQVSNALIPLVLNPVSTSEDMGTGAERRTTMNIVGGNYATILSLPPRHERRRSWTGGEKTEWSSFSSPLSSGKEIGNGTSSELDSDHTVESVDGDLTPVAKGARSPELRLDSDSSSASSPENRPLTLKRSTTNLQALVSGDDSGILTPPSSTHSSPPSPRMDGLSLSPSQSSAAASTGESSPVNTVSSDSIPDLANLDIEIDPDERGRTMGGSNYKMLSNSYQEFVSVNFPSYGWKRAYRSYSWINSVSSNHLV